MPGARPKETFTREQALSALDALLQHPTLPSSSHAQDTLFQTAADWLFYGVPLHVTPELLAQKPHQLPDWVKANLNRGDDQGTVPLFIALALQNKTAVAYLLAQGAHADYLSPKGMSALAMAVRAEVNANGQHDADLAQQLLVHLVPLAAGSGRRATAVRVIQALALQEAQSLKHHASAEMIREAMSVWQQSDLPAATSAPASTSGVTRMDRQELNMLVAISQKNLPDFVKLLAQCADEPLLRRVERELQGSHTVDKPFRAKAGMQLHERIAFLQGVAAVASADAEWAKQLDPLDQRLFCGNQFVLDNSAEGSPERVALWRWGLPSSYNEGGAMMLQVGQMRSTDPQALRGVIEPRFEGGGLPINTVYYPEGRTVLGEAVRQKPVNFALVRLLLETYGADMNMPANARQPKITIRDVLEQKRVHKRIWRPGCLSRVRTSPPWHP